jgi:hypothetical protein
VGPLKVLELELMVAKLALSDGRCDLSLNKGSNPGPKAHEVWPLDIPTVLGVG